jgi:hypothetical protein
MNSGEGSSGPLQRPKWQDNVEEPRASGVNLVGAVMNSDVVYSYLVSGSWMFLVGWVLLLVLAFFAVFHHET